MNNETATAELAAATMRGELITACIDELKAAPDCWQKMCARQQDETIERISLRVGELIAGAVQIIAADGREVITAELEQITAKDGIKAVCTLAKHDPNRHALLDSVGKAVLIVVADAQQFMGGDVPEPDPDQLSLPVADAGRATRGDA